MQPTHKMFIQMFIPTIDLPLRNWPMDSFKQRFACSGGYRKCPSNWWRGIVGPAGLEPRPAVRKMSGGHFKAGARLRRGLECDPLIIWHNIPILFQFHQTLVKEGYGISITENPLLDAAQYQSLILANFRGNSFAENQLVFPVRSPLGPKQKVNRLHS